MKSLPVAEVRGARRSEEERIKDLEAQIEALKQRKVRKQQRRDPALRHMHLAVRSIDKAITASSDHATRQALGEARNTLAACLAVVGAMPNRARATLAPQAGRPARPISEDALLSHVRANPGQRSEQIAAGLGSSTDVIRPVLRGLIKAGKVATQGQARAMSYAGV